MKNFLGALLFLTTIPLPKKIKMEFSPDKIRTYFPIVGLFLGLIVASFDFFMCQILPASTTSWLDVIMLIFLTGALHLDGVADTADGIFSHRSTEDMLKIMKDSRIGTMGVLAIVSVLGIKYFGITGIDNNRFLIITLIPAYSRTSMVIAMKFLGYCRDQGTAKGFFASNVKLNEFIPFAFIIFISLYLGKDCFLLNSVFFISTFLIIFYYKKTLGCITGDTLGCMCEVIESILFLVLS